MTGVLTAVHLRWTRISRGWALASNLRRGPDMSRFTILLGVLGLLALSQPADAGQQLGAAYARNRQSGGRKPARTT
ncbi:MAG TPA: hypothetical protein VMZ28_07925, partial [Kofleriaceae bacterium]|nr:hypothetical protein [Kofleriaceae bacterium]